MFHLSSHGRNLICFSIAHLLNKRKCFFVSFLCILKCLNFFHECLNVPTKSQKCSRRRQEKITYWRAGLFIWPSFLLLMYFRKSAFLSCLPLLAKQDFSWGCFWEAICFARLESDLGSLHLPSITLSTLELGCRGVERGYIAICRHLTACGRWLLLFSHATHWAERISVWLFFSSFCCLLRHTCFSLFLQIKWLSQRTAPERR